MRSRRKLKSKTEKNKCSGNLIIVDGHNFIFSYVRARNLSTGRIEYLKNKLVRDLIFYKFLKSWDAIVVFDARNSDNTRRGDSIIDGLRIIHSKKGETADDVIEELAGMEMGYKSIFVVTSDYLQQKVIFRKNVFRKSSREFGIEIRSLRKKIRDNMNYSRESYDRKFLSLGGRLSVSEKEKLLKLL
jgi:uncharacterized protein